MSTMMRLPIHIVSGESKKTVPNVSIRIGSNFGVDDIKKQIETCTRLCPTDPNMDIDKIEVLINKQFVDITSENAYSLLKENAKNFQSFKVTTKTARESNEENLKPKVNNNRSTTPSALNKARARSPHNNASRMSSAGVLRPRPQAQVVSTSANASLNATAASVVASVLDNSKLSTRMKTPTKLRAALSERISDTDKSATGTSIAKSANIKVVNPELNQNILLCPVVVREKNSLTRLSSSSMEEESMNKKSKLIEDDNDLDVSVIKYTEMAESETRERSFGFSAEEEDDLGIHNTWRDSTLFTALSPDMSPIKANSNEASSVATQEVISMTVDEPAHVCENECEIIAMEQPDLAEGKTQELSPPPVARRSVRRVTPSVSKTPTKARPGVFLTAGELSNKFVNNIRQCDYSSIVTGGVLQSVGAPRQMTPGKTRVFASPAKARSSSRGQRRPIAATAPAENELSPVFPGGFSKKLRKTGEAEEGRLSINSLMRQCDLLKKICGMSEEDIEWTAVKDNDGAYKYANSKQMRAEDNYFKSIWEIDYYSQLSKAINTTSSSKFYQLINSMLASAEVFNINPYDQKELNKIIEEKDQMHKLLHDSTYKCMGEGTYVNMSSNLVVHNTTLFSDTLFKSIMELLESKELKDVPRKAKIIKERYFLNDCKDISEKLLKAQQTQESSLMDMEKWEKRKQTTKEYSACKAEEEKAWLDAEESANKEALETMRSFIPVALVNGASLSVNDIMQLATERGGVYSYELANEIKSNKLLHMLVKHISDIASASFLTGESKQYFENLENLDLIECRALVYALSSLTKFSNDNDGKKWDWRNRLFTKCKTMIDQYNGIEVKGAWDSKANKRSMVKLPELSKDKLRRSVYYYKNHTQFLQRLKQYDDKLALLAKKELWLAQAKKASEEAQSEWTLLLAELRDETLQNTLDSLTKEQKDSLKKEAFELKSSSERKLKALLTEVANLKKSIEESPVSRDMFVAAKEQLVEYLGNRGISYENTAEAILIVGVFDREPEIMKQASNVVKLLSAEEEKQRIQDEINQLKLNAAAEETEVVVTLPEETTNFPKTPGRRNSILDSVNPELLLSLNKNLSSMAGDRKSIKTPIAPKKLNIEGDFAAAISSVIPVKEVQSKLLKKLFQSSTDSELNNNKVSEKPAMSFLEQIKLRRVGAEVGSESTLPPPPPAGMSFLDQIKMRRSEQLETNAPPKLSLLDEIKLRAKQ